MGLIKEKYWDFCSGIFLFVFSIVLFYGGMTVKTLEVSTFGSGFFPKVVAVILALTSLPIIAGGLQKARIADGKEEKLNPRWWAVLATFGIMLAYAALIPKLGFIITTTVYLFLQMQILADGSKRKHVLFAVIAVSASVIIYFTFVKVFNLMLPAGILG